MDRGAIAIWSGVGTNAGTLTTDSGALLNTPLLPGVRYELESKPTSTTPEELLAAAYAGDFTLDLVERLEASGHPPVSLRTEARVQVVKPSGYWEIPAIRLHCSANVLGISEEEFLALVREARTHGPIARTLRADLVVTVSLESVPGYEWTVSAQPPA